MVSHRRISDEGWPPVSGVPRRALFAAVAATLVLLIATSLEAGTGEVPAAPLARTDSADVAAALHRFHDALSAGDSSAALALLADDALIVEAGDVQTREQYRSHHLSADIVFARAVPSTRSIVHVTVRGDAAWVTTTSVTEGTYNGRVINSWARSSRCWRASPAGGRFARYTGRRTQSAPHRSAGAPAITAILRRAASGRPPHWSRRCC